MFLLDHGNPNSRKSGDRFEKSRRRVLHAQTVEQGVRNQARIGAPPRFDSNHRHLSCVFRHGISDHHHCSASKAVLLHRRLFLSARTEECGRGAQMSLPIRMSVPSR